jgi:hypothetical protein
MACYHLCLVLLYPYIGIYRNIWMRVIDVLHSINDAVHWSIIVLSLHLSSVAELLI